jgi:integrase
LARACAKVGCAKLTHHSLRHWFATLALERTKDAKQVSEWLGQRDGGKLVWQLYGHTREENEKKSAEKLDFNWAA